MFLSRKSRLVVNTHWYCLVFHVGDFDMALGSGEAGRVIIDQTCVVSVVAATIIIKNNILILSVVIDIAFALRQ